MSLRTALCQVHVQIPLVSHRILSPYRGKSDDYSHSRNFPFVFDYEMMYCMNEGMHEHYAEWLLIDFSVCRTEKKGNLYRPFHLHSIPNSSLLTQVGLWFNSGNSTSACGICKIEGLFGVAGKMRP